MDMIKYWPLLKDLHHPTLRPLARCRLYTSSLADYFQLTSETVSQLCRLQKLTRGAHQAPMSLSRFPPRTPLHPSNRTPRPAQAQAWATPWHPSFETTQALLLPCLFDTSLIDTGSMMWFTPVSMDGVGFTCYGVTDEHAHSVSCQSPPRWNKYSSKST